MGQSMISDIDIYRAAKLTIDRHGDRALIEAALRQDELLSAGDTDGAKVWSRIESAIEWMQSSECISTEILH